MLDLLDPANGFVFLLISFLTDSVKLLYLVLSCSFLLQWLFEANILITQHINFSLKFINDSLVMFDVILAVHEALLIFRVHFILLVGQELNLFCKFFRFCLWLSEFLWENLFFLLEVVVCCFQWLNLHFSLLWILFNVLLEFFHGFLTFLIWKWELTDFLFFFSGIIFECFDILFVFSC